MNEITQVTKIKTLEVEDDNILSVEVPEHLKTKVPSGVSFFDVVTSGGLVPSTTSMLSGAPGAGKTTLCCQVADSLTAAGHIVLFNSAEQTKEQVSHLCRERLKLNNGFKFKTYKTAEEIIEYANLLKVTNPGKKLFVIVDSLTKLAHGKRSVAQDIGNQFIDFCQESHAIGIFIVHLTKNGQFQGNNGMLHDFDAYFHMEADDLDENDEGDRRLMTKKNRFGKMHVVFTRLTDHGHVGPDDEIEELSEEDFIID